MEGAMTLFMTTVMLFLVPGVKANMSNATDAEFNITRTSCGSTRQCVETPTGCDPAGNSTCLFGSVNSSIPMPPNGVQMTFGLSGNSTGFIALGLTANATLGTSMLFVCAQNNSGGFFFKTMTLNNTNQQMISANTTVTASRGKVNNDKIQCEFTVPNVNASTSRSSQDTTFVVILGSGTVNGTTLGNFKSSLVSEPLNLSSTTSGANQVLHSHAVLLLLSMITLSFLRIV